MVKRSKKHGLLHYAAQQLKSGIDIRIGETIESLMEWALKHFNEHLYTEPSLFHDWISEHFTSFHTKRGQKVCIIAPRGNAKSTWLTLIYVTLCALEGWEPYIVIVSDSATQARLMLEGIKEAIEFNMIVRKNYEHVAGKGPVWTQDRIRLKNGVLIEAFGTKGKIRGRRKSKDRPSLIVIDDAQNDENIESAAQRIKAQNWLDKAVIPAGNKQTNIILIGTSLHRQSLVMNALNNPVWETFLFKSVLNWPKRMDLWKQWEEIYCDKSIPRRYAVAQAFYEANKKAMHRGAIVLWPDEESLLDLMKLRLLIGPTSFESEKQNNPRKPDTVEFSEEYFGPWMWVTKDNWRNPWGYDHKVITVDPSKGKDAKKGDYSAIVKVGRCPNKLMWCEADLKRRPVPLIISDTVQHALQFRPDAIGIEANAFQELMGDMLLKELSIWNLENIPVYPIINTVNKQVRIRRLGGPLYSREFRFLDNHPDTKMMVEQLEDFPNGSHDDGPDALEMARRLLIDIVNNELTAHNLGNQI